MLYAVTLLIIVFILPAFNSGRKSVEGELFYETSVKKGYLYLLFVSILQIVYLESNPMVKLVSSHTGLLVYYGTRFISQGISFQLSHNMLLIY